MSTPDPDARVGMTSPKMPAMATGHSQAELPSVDKRIDMLNFRVTLLEGISRLELQPIPLKELIRNEVANEVARQQPKANSVPKFLQITLFLMATIIAVSLVIAGLKVPR